MKRILFSLLLLATPLSAKVYDCFLFFNEFEILKIRLAELDPLVDHFVLVESVESFQGKPKPLYFEENREIFAPYLDKIIHVVVEAHPEFVYIGSREGYQRNAIARGLVNAQDGDLVILSDCDEIPRRENARRVVDSLKKNPKQFFVFDLVNYCYRLNTPTNGVWYGSVASSYGIFKHIEPEEYREWRRSPLRFPKHVPKSGWHLTNMGDRKALAYKYDNYGHPEHLYDLDRYIARFLQLATVPIDDTFPEYIKENEEYFRLIGLINDIKNP